jgi:hypothetical protein
VGVGARGELVGLNVAVGCRGWGMAVFEGVGVEMGICVSVGVAVV